MAVFIKATYVKKLGLPQYSSHQYSVEVSAELTDLTQLPQASADLYARLQQAVDSQIVNQGYIPGDTSAPPPASASSPTRPASSVGTGGGTGTGEDESWRCSDKQRDLILKIVDEHRLDKTSVDALARQRFGVGVKQLNKLQASGLIDELIETHGSANQGRGRSGGGNGGERRGGYSRAYASGRGRQ
jgi:hypothetical protein